MARMQMKDHKPGDVVIVTEGDWTGPAMVGHNGTLFMPGPGTDAGGWANSLSYPDADWQAVELVATLPTPEAR